MKSVWIVDIQLVQIIEQEYATLLTLQLPDQRKIIFELESAEKVSEAVKSISELVVQF